MFTQGASIRSGQIFPGINLKFTVQCIFVLSACFQEVISQMAGKDSFLLTGVACLPKDLNCLVY